MELRRPLPVRARAPTAVAVAAAADHVPAGARCGRPATGAFCDARPFVSILIDNCQLIKIPRIAARPQSESIITASDSVG